MSDWNFEGKKIATLDCTQMANFVNSIWNKTCKEVQAIAESQNLKTRAKNQLMIVKMAEQGIEYRKMFGSWSRCVDEQTFKATQIRLLGEVA